MQRILLKCTLASTHSRRSVQHRIASSHQVRYFPWVPSAYRRPSRTRPRPTPRPRGRTQAKRKRGHASQPGGEKTFDISKFENFRQESLNFQLRCEQDRLASLQSELEQILSTYWQSLHSSNKSGEKMNTSNTRKQSKRPPKKKETNIQEVTRCMTALTTQLNSVHANCVPTSLKHVEETEDEFRNVCKFVDDMIDVCLKIQSLILKQSFWNKNIKKSGEMEITDEATTFSYCSLAEDLLLALIELQTARFQYLEGISKNNDDEAENSVSWFGWLKNKVLDAPTTQNNQQTKSDQIDDSEPVPLMAHEDPLCGPRLEHFQKLADLVVRTLREETTDDESQSQFRKIRRPQRLQQLLEKMPPNVVPDVASIRTLMNAYAMIGSYESARACEKVMEEYPPLRDEVFGSLLHAYFLASKSSPRNQERSKAAARAYELVRQKWQDVEHYDTQKFAHCTKALLCLNLVGKDAIPDVCIRADSLVYLCIGRENLEEIFQNENLEALWKIAPANICLPLLNCLVLIYASSGDASRVNLAKRLLTILLEDSDFKSDEEVLYPDVRSCKTVLSALVSSYDRRIRWARAGSDGYDQQKKSAKHPRELALENLNYGINLLDLMFARSQCWPDRSYFHLLLRLVNIAKQKNASVVAQDILTKMQVRECFERLEKPIVSKKTYHHVFRALLVSAEAGQHDAAKSALELLEFMEAQSLPLLSPEDLTKPIGSLGYNSSLVPDRATYQIVLKICSSIKTPFAKENAMDIALKVDTMMKKRGILPNSDTYSMLLACCANLLPDNSKRRHNVTQQLLEDARNQGNVNEAILERLENDGDDASDSDDETKPESGGGLLSDLT